MPKNNFLLFILLGLVACTQKPGPALLISHLDKIQQGPKVLERRLASSPKVQCLKDIYTVETLREEVKEAEKAYNSPHRAKGQWRHLNLSSLPVPQANFLKIYGDKLGDLKDEDSIDYSTCEDVPCIFNRIYGSENGIAGYVHYLWYLKFGHYLSADNHVPEGEAGRYNDQDVPLEKYLYSEDELYAFWRLSLMLPPINSRLVHLKEIQRLPRGHDFEDKEKDGSLKFSALTCGVASNGGWIKLKDSCLTLNKTNKDLGYFYVSVTHELAHHVDYMEGNERQLTFRSHDLDYGEISGFELLQEWIQYGRVQRKWKLKKDHTKLPSGYGGSSPQENFAEVLARFRVEGDDIKNLLTQDHLNFVSEGYYENQSFDSPALYQRWLRKHSQDISKEVFQAVIDCSKDSSGHGSQYFNARDFADKILPVTLNCLGARASRISDAVSVKVKLYEPDGCVALGKSNRQNSEENKRSWESAIREHLRAQFDQYLQELKKDENYLARVSEFYDELADKTLARSSYFECFEAANAEVCYKQVLEKSISNKDRFLEMYLDYHPFSKIKQEVMSFYRSVALSNEELLRNKGDDVWAVCRDMSHNDDQPPTGSFFKVGDGYLISSFYNCLNAHLPDTVTEIVQSLSYAGMKVLHSTEEVILSREIAPRLSSYLKEVYKNEKEAEANKAKLLLDGDKGELRKKIVHDFSWIKNAAEKEQIEKDCRTVALGLVPFIPIYHTKSELFGSLISTSCANISEGPEFDQWFKEEKMKFDEKIVSDLESKLMELAEAQARECLKRYPVDTNVNRLRYKREREACLTSKWPGMENRVIQKTQNDPQVKLFNTNLEERKSKLESSRRKLQIRVFKKYFN